MAVVDVKYNTHSFQTTSVKKSQIITRDIMFEHIADKTLMRKEDSIRNGFSILDDRYSHKIITLRGWLISDTPEHFREHIDTVKGYLRPNEKDLDIETYGGSPEWRRYIASCQSLTIESEHWMSTQSPYEATFLAQPFGKATDSTPITLGSNETKNFEKTFTIAGSYRAKPTITFTMTLGDNLTTIKLENDTNDDWIQVTKTALPDDVFKDDDQLIINCDNETVQVLRGGDYTNVDFTGIFPQLSTGSNTLDITLTKSNGVQITAKLLYFATYL